MICHMELRELKSERLVLRKVRREDVSAYYRNLGSSEAVTRGMLWNPHQDISESVASVEKTLRRYGEGRCYRWAVTEQGSEELIGIVELLRFEETDCSCSFAYMLAQRVWGRGYGTEVLKTVFRFAFEEMGVKRMMLRTAKRTVIVADHQKIGRTALVRICDLKDADLLITDSLIPADTLKKLRKVAGDIILA